MIVEIGEFICFIKKCVRKSTRISINVFANWGYVMGSVRGGCNWIPRCKSFRADDPTENEKLVGRAGEYVPFEQPDFLRTLRALGDFHDWVEGKLFPIIGKYIEEHREEITQGMTEDEMNDMGAAIEAAFKHLQTTGWLTAQDQKFVEVDEQKMFAEGRANPLWYKETLAFFEAEEAVKNK